MDSGDIVVVVEVELEERFEFPKIAIGLNFLNNQKTEHSNFGLHLKVLYFALDY